MSEIIKEQVRVAIVGAGPAGIGAAIGLARRGVAPVLLLDRWDKPGGIPAKYSAEAGGVRTYVQPARGRVLHGQQFVDHLLDRLASTEVELRLECTVLELNAERRELTVVDPMHGKTRIAADAIVLATGAREETAVERGWIAGGRDGHRLQTMQLLQLSGRGKRLSWGQPVVAGSDLIAYAAAAKLMASGAPLVRMVDTSTRPRASWFARWYFRRWGRPEWQCENSLNVSPREGDSRIWQLRFQNDRPIPCDALIVSGHLVPNAELLVEARLETRTPLHLPVTGACSQLSAPGCFATGNLLGGFHGGSWCTQSGLRVAKAVSRYLEACPESAKPTW